MVKARGITSSSKTPIFRGRPSRVPSRLVLSVAAALASIAVLVCPPATLAHGLPTFGLSVEPNTQGFGEVKPARIFLGGDVSGLVRGVHWHGWGRAKAIGHGTGWFVPPDANTIADGHPARAKVVAWDLGRCDGRWAYQKGDWSFPEYNRHGNVPPGTSLEPGYGLDLCAAN